MQQIADLFCGAGGTSTGVLQAAQELGRKVNLVAVNHWDLAISTHSENHPDVSHYNSDLQSLDPLKVVPSGKLRLLVASPECTHFSRARGGKPMSKQSRASIKWVIKWINVLDVEDILIENVPDFLTWGPLEQKTKLPIKDRKGEYFHRFVRKLRSLGYTVDWRVLNAADYGDPTTRKRLFIIARKGKAIHWPEPTHNKDGGDMFGARPRWRSAREIIDWTIKSESIFKRKRPLAENTMKRIMAGLMKYGGKSFVLGQQSGSAPREVDQPIPTVSGAGAISLIEPYLVEYHNGPNSEKRTRSVDQPLPTLDTSNRFGLAQPFIVQMDQGGALHDIDKPMSTITSADAWALVEPFILPQFSTGSPRSVDDPLSTITSTSRGIALVEPFIVTTNWAATNRSPARSIDEPIPTIMGHKSIGLAEPFLVEYYGTGQSSSIDEPIKTLTGRDRFALVEPMTFEHGGKRYVLDIRFRMLQPHELARAMSFPDDYRFHGNREQVVKQIGNAVPVSLARELVKSLLK